MGIATIEETNPTEEEKKKLIEKAKWNMYGEEWEVAELQLHDAKEIAISLRNKDQIDEMLSLIIKCKTHEKPEL